MRLFTFLLLSLLAAPSAGAYFEDVPTTHPHFRAIEALREKGMIEGYGGSAFAPDAWIGRAEFVKILIEGFASDEQIEACDTRAIPFSDVEWESWYAKYVCLAEERGLVKGYADGTFRPADNINTAEAATILARTFVGPQSENGVWYRSSLETLGVRGVLPDTLMHVGQSLRRGQMAEMVYRLQGGNASEPSLGADELERRSQSFAPASYGYDWMNRRPDIALGTQVGGMRFAKRDGAHVIFTGDIVVTGRYVDYSNVDGMNYPGVCMDQFTTDTLPAIPGAPYFCLDNDYLASKVPVGSTGTMTVRITEIDRFHCECEAWDVATAIEIIEIVPDPTDETSCRAAGGDWQENVVRSTSWHDDGSVTEQRGYCYPPDSPYAGKMTEFDACGSLPSYSGERWYEDFTETAVIAHHIRSESIIELCAAVDGSMVVFLRTDDSGQSEVWKFVTESDFLQKASVSGMGPEFHMDEFQKREGHIIPLIERKDFPDFCRSESHAEYDYVSNVLRNIGGGCVEMYDR